MLIPAALFACVLGLAAFDYTGDFFFRLCPPERLEYLGSELDYIGGGAYACLASWYPWARALTIFVGAMVASSSFILLPTLIEPKEHFLAAVIAYAVGATLTSPMLLIGLFSVVTFLIAITMLAVGLGCVLLVKKWFGVGRKAVSLLPKWLVR